MYAKIFRQIYDSSIAEDPQVRFTFMDMLVLADSDGVVDMTPEAIARVTNVPIDWVKRSISILESADPRSRTEDHNGARIARLDYHRDWGWVILNYDKFRELATEEHRKQKNREYVQRHREKRSKSIENEQCNGSVRGSKENVRGTYAYAYVGTDQLGDSVKGGKFQKPTMPEMELHASKIGLPATEVDRFFNYYESNGWRVGRNPMKSWQAAMVNWRKNFEERTSPDRSFRPKQAADPRTYLERKFGIQ